MREMRKAGILLVILIFSLLIVQTPGVKANDLNYWARSYGGSGTDVLKDVKVLPNGSIIAVGYTNSTGVGGKDVLVMKLTSNGSVVWAKTYGGTKDDEATAVALAPNGDIIVVGYTYSFGAGDGDVWVLRLDADGNVKWQKTYGGKYRDEANAVALAPNGDIIVAGWTDSFRAGYADAWVLRLDSEGNVKWQKAYGGSYYDGAYAVALAPNGDIIVAGWTLSFGAGGSNVWVLRLDENGNIRWQKTYGGSGDDEAYAVAVANNGDIIVAGYYGANWGGSGGDVWVLRLDERGNIKWQKTYGGGSDDEATAVALAPNGDVIVAGYTYSFGAYGDAWVLRLDENGNVKWQKTYGGSSTDVALAVALASNGDIIVAGFYGAIWNSKNGDWEKGDVWVLRLPPDGNLPGLSEDSNAEVTRPSADVETSSAEVEESDATPQDSHAYPNQAELTVKTQYGPATLEINSDPSGAKVYVDGDYKGVTPLGMNLTPGTYEVKLIKKDYKNYTTTVTINPGESKTISATLTPAFGYLSVDSTPQGAKVYIDDSYAGETPLKDYKLSTGKHTVKVVKDGYEEFTKTVTVNPGEKASVTASLVAIITTTTTSSSSPQTTTSPSTQTAQATASGIPKTYILAGLIILGLIGGLAVKMRGGPERKPPAKAETPWLEKKKGKPEIKKPVITPPKTVEEKPAPTPAPAEKKAETPPMLPGFPAELLSRYEPLELLGEGGFAKVFRVKRRKDGKIVALKIPRIDEKTSKTFIREVSTWLHLDHPNIVKLHDVDILPVPYLEMEFVEGIELNGKTVRTLDGYPKPADEETALNLVKGIAEGLSYAHSKGIYHRDLKPLNVLLKADLTPKITDWGLAKLGTMSSSRSVMGYTPLYAAPEHLMPSKYGHTDARTDIWQLGVTFYELLTGKLPFEGYTYEEVFGKIVDENYRFTPPSKLNPDLAKYDGIFERLLAKKKEGRYGSVDEFLKDLERVEESEKRKAELEKEIEELKKSLAKSIQALKQSKSTEEIIKNRRMAVESLGKLTLAYAELNRKAELLNALNDLKFYTIKNLGDLTNAINTVEMLIRESLPVSKDFIERLKVLVHEIRRENERIL